MTDPADMSERAAFIRNIIDQPDDDTVRLVFADWLDENGEPRWAAFIRSHVANPEPRRASSLPMPLSKTIFAAERWSGLPASQITLTRGFPSAVECTAGYWLEWGDGIRAAHPVRRVVLTTAPLSSVSTEWRWSLEGDPRATSFAGREIHAEIDRESPRRPEHEHLRAHLRLRWPGIEFELPAQHRGIVRRVNALQDYTADDMAAMREAGRQSAMARERRVIDGLFNPPAE